VRKRTWTFYAKTTGKVLEERALFWN